MKWLVMMSYVHRQLARQPFLILGKEHGTGIQIMGFDSVVCDGPLDKSLHQPEPQFYCLSKTLIFSPRLY